MVYRGMWSMLLPKASVFRRYSAVTLMCASIIMIVHDYPFRLVFCVAPEETTIDNRLQSVNMNDMVDLGSSGTVTNPSSPPDNCLNGSDQTDPGCYPGRAEAPFSRKQHLSIF